MSAVRVCVRVKPTESNPKVDGNSIMCGKQYTFDRIFQCNNKELFNDIGSSILSHALEGYNICLFAYGQTGSGKTHSIMGNKDEPGVLLLLCETICEAAESVTASFVEIYQEQVRDLLTDSQVALRIREHPENGPYVEGAEEVDCNSAQDLLELLNIGNQRRIVGHTSSTERESYTSCQYS